MILQTSLFLTGILFTYAAIPQARKYTTKYDHVDWKEMTKNDRLLQVYVNCLLETGKCTPDGLAIKKNMADAFETECSKCSKKQLEVSQLLTQYIIENKPDVWSALEEKYNPSGSYKRKYLELKSSEVRAKPLFDY